MRAGAESRLAGSVPVQTLESAVNLCDQSVLINVAEPALSSAQNREGLGFLLIQQVDVIHLVGSLVSVIRALHDLSGTTVSTNNGCISAIGLAVDRVCARNATLLQVDTPAMDFDNHDTFARFRASVHNITLLIWWFGLGGGKARFRVQPAKKDCSAKKAKQHNGG